MGKNNKTTTKKQQKNNNKYISDITDPILTKLEIITITTETTTIITKTKTTTHSTTKTRSTQILAIDDLNQTKLKLGFWIKNNNKAKTMK